MAQKRPNTSSALPHKKVIDMASSHSRGAVAAVASTATQVFGWKRLGVVINGKNVTT